MTKWLAAAAGCTLTLPVLLIVLVAATGAPAATVDEGGPNGPPSALAKNDIPPDYLRSYTDAAGACPSLPWSVLAGIGKVESDHGRSVAPGVHAGANRAGARGPMQFLPSTFARHGVDGDGDGRTDVYNPTDAIHSAANYLCASGARGGTDEGLREAIYAYNHADSYVDQVLEWAAKYTAPTVSDVAAKAITFAKRQIGDPYVWGAEGPDAYDCSGLTYAAYKHAGVTIGRTTHQWRQTGPRIRLSEIQPGDLLYSAGSRGTATNPGHVVMYLGDDKVIEAPQSGSIVQISPLDLPSITIATRPAALAH